jgi:predicted nuclease with TOPRIM domain
MTSERRRHELYRELQEVLSDESADELMSALPPVGWADVATKSDVAMIRHELDALRAELRGEFQHEFGRLRGEFGELRGQFGELRGEFGELRGEFGELRGEFGELRGELGELRGEFGGELGHLRAEMIKGYQSLQRWTISTMIALTAIVFAAVRLGV